MSFAERHNVQVTGPDGAQPMVFAHGFGCDQRMWRYVAPHFADRYRVVTFDNMGAGGSDPTGYDFDRYSSLGAYAEDVVSICRELDLAEVIFVGHSVSAMVGALASLQAPDLFARLVFVSPSARYVNDGEYFGGFSDQDITELLDSLEANYLGWSGAMAPVIMGNADRPELGDELTDSFCRTDPAIAGQFAQVTFRSDNRADLSRVTTPTLVLQCKDDVIAPVVVGEFVRDALPHSSFVLLDAVGHCPNLSAPHATIAAIEDFLVLEAVASP